MTIEQLIARLESATEGSRELDEAIYRLCFSGKLVNRLSSGGKIWTTDLEYTPLYTTMADAALTLLPEWMSFELTRSAAGPPTFTRCRLWDWRRGPAMSDPDNEWKSEGNRPLPISISAAALKARVVA